MKKLVSILAIMFVTIVTIAQTNTVISRVNNYFEYTGVATADTVGGTVTTWNKPILLSGEEALFYYSKVKVTETADFACTIKLQGKYFDSDTFTDITTINYTGVGSDTTAIFSELSTAVKYKHFNILVTRTAGTGKVSFVKFMCKK